MRPAVRSGQGGLLVLTILLLVTVAWLVFFDRSATIDGPGPLFTYLPDEIRSVGLEAPGRTVVLEADASGRWHIAAGGAEEIDAAGLAEFLGYLCLQTGTEIVPGTDDAADGATASGGDRSQYGLAPGQGAVLTLTGPGGRSERVELGRRHPVGERFYAAGAGRRGVFMVAAELAERLALLPDLVILRALWQPFDTAEVDTVVVRDTAGEHLLARDESGSWWLRPDDRSLPAAESALAGYARHYGDRRREAGGRIWLRAADRELRRLLVLLRRTTVAPDPARSADRTGTDAGRVSVRIALAGDPVLRSVVFGDSLEAERNRVTRCGHGRSLVARGEAGPIARRPLSAYVAAGLLAVSAQRVDSLEIRRLDRPDLPALRGTRQRGRLLAVIERPGVPYDFYRGFTRLIDAQERVVALPPATGPPLAAERSYAVDLWLPPTAGGVASRMEFRVGRLPAGGQAAVWFPATQKLLLVTEELSITLDNAFLAL